MNEAQIHELTVRLAQALTAKGWRLATAESCTGGWIAKCCTDLAGSSAWFERGFVTYSNEAKVGMLGVEADRIEAQGAVSGAVAEQMAKGARRAAGVEVAVAVTGVAGPEGGSAEKPVGTVWFAWSVNGLDVDSACLHFDGDRNSVRVQSVEKAILGLLSRLGRC